MNKYFNEELNCSVRIIYKNNVSWVCGKDAASFMGYANPQYAVKKYVKDEDKFVYSEKGFRVVFINKNGLNDLYLHSTEDKNIIIEFANWINDLKLIVINDVKAKVKNDDIKTEYIAVNKSQNDLQIFKHDDFGSVRSIMIDDIPYFVGKDVAEILGYSNPQKALRDHVDDEDKTLNESFTVNGTMGILINESGLYSLILRSRLPVAKKFKRWVTSEVLPSIRKHGGYIMNQENLSNEEVLANAILIAKNIIDEKDKIIKEMAPKVKFAETVSSSESNISVQEMAKLLNTTTNKLMEFLRDKGWVMKTTKSNGRNLPIAKYIEKGYLTTKETPYNANGTTRLSVKTMITGKGQIVLTKLYNETNGGF